MFTLVHSHKSYSATELERMIPWEFDLVVSQTNGWVKDQTEKQKLAETEKESSMKRTLQSLNRKKR